MTGDYLNVLDGLLTTGVSYLSPAFREVQIRFVLSTIQPDGGFRGRQGGSDLYYTDFALRVLSICGYDLSNLQNSAEFVLGTLKSPRDLVECFNALNAIRILGFSDVALDFNRTPVFERIQAQKLSTGAFSRKGGRQASAYNTFLAKLCYDMLGEDFPELESAAQAVLDLQGSDGGFCESALETLSQTSSTAAAVTFLLMTNQLTHDVIENASAYFLSMQRFGGGLLPCAGAPEDDLLSTFTALSCLFLTDSLERLDISSIGRMTKSCLDPAGGFRACSSDNEADVEYTFYGLGTLAILNLYREASKHG